MAKFEIGQLVCTKSVTDMMEEDSKFSNEILISLQKYIACNWGNISEEDGKLNDDAVATGDDRILAAYDTSKGKIFIITEWDRSVTTILFASEY